MSRALDGGLLLCAEAERRFAELTHGVLGHRLQEDGSMWWTPAPLPPMFVQAASLRPDGLARVPDRVAALPGRALFRDTFSSVDLSDRGFVADRTETWMVRPAGPMEERPRVPGLVVARAVTARAVGVFERTAFANAGDLDSYVPGSVHPAAATAKVADLYLLVGYLDDRPVATAVAVAGAAVVGVQAVTTHPDVRRRGIGAAMLAACCAWAPGRPVALSATAAGAALYRVLGFTALGPATEWSRPTASPES